MKRSWLDWKNTNNNQERRGKLGNRPESAWVTKSQARSAADVRKIFVNSASTQAIESSESCQLRRTRCRWQHNSQRRQRRVILAETEPPPTAHRKKWLCLSYAQFPRGQRIQSSIMHDGVWVECGSGTTQDMTARLRPIRAKLAPGNKAG